MKNILISLMVLLIAIGLAVPMLGGTFASFSDIEISQGNYIETADLDLKVNGKDDLEVETFFDIPNGQICTTYTSFPSPIPLTNEGSVDGPLYLHIKKLVGPDSLSQNVDMEIWYDDSWVTKGSLYNLACQQIELGHMPADGIIKEVRMELHAGGGAPGEGLTFDIAFELFGACGYSDIETSRGNYFGLGRHTGVLLPTGVSVQMYVSGNWLPMYDSFYYTVKKNKINSVSPGVMFYYNTIEAASGDIVVIQDNTANWRAFTVHKAQAYLYDTALNIVKIGTASQVGNKYLVTFGSSGLTPGATYYIGIKFSPKDMPGQAIPFHGATQTEYFFSTEIGGVSQLGSDDSITLLPKP